MRSGFVLAVLAAVGFLFWYSDVSSALASPKTVVTKKAPPMDVAYERTEAHSYLNAIRRSAGMIGLSENGKLSAAAQAHADYLVRNDTATHDEIPEHEGFTGRRPMDRALKAGYEASLVSENFSTKNHSAKNSVDGLFSAIYHRFGFLDPSIDQVGVGVTEDPNDSDRSAFVYLMGNSGLEELCTMPGFKGSGKYVYKVCRDPKHRIAEKKFNRALEYNKKHNPRIILYPCDGQMEVPPAFYREIPDPLPDYEVSGFPVSVVFNDYFFRQVRLESFKLFAPGGEEVAPVRFMDRQSDPNGRFTSHQFALFPLKRLEYDTQYRAEIVYRTGRGEEHLSWTFTTQRPSEKLHTVTEREVTLTLDPARSHMLYFRPLGPHDMIDDVRFPLDVDVSFLDNHTLKISPISGNTDDFDITGGGRIVHIKLK